MNGTTKTSKDSKDEKVSENFDKINIEINE